MDEHENAEEYESDYDRSIRARWRNAWIEILGWFKQMMCGHERTRVTRQTVHCGKDYEITEAEDVTACVDCGKVIRRTPAP